MTIYAISDTHFGHEKLVQLTGRPVDFGERILSSVRKIQGDILIHCGDFCIGNDVKHHAEFISAAKGFKKKILVRGNHDHKSDAWYYDMGWDFVCEMTWIRQFGMQIMFTHMPFLEPTDGTFSPHFKPDILVHGHLHGNSDRHGIHPETYDTSWFYDLAPEANKYSLINLEKIVNEVKSLKDNQTSKNSSIVL